MEAKEMLLHPHLKEPRNKNIYLWILLSNGLTSFSVDTKETEEDLLWHQPDSDGSVGVGAVFL